MSIKKVLLSLLFLGSVAMAQNTVTVTASNIQSAPSVPLPSGTILFQAIGTNGQAVSYQIGGGGQVITAPTVCPISNGAITGTCTVANVLLTQPQNLCFSTTVKNSSNQIVLGGPKSGYQCVQPMPNSAWCTAGTCDFDNFSPYLPSTILTIVLPPPYPATLGGIYSTGCATGTVVTGYDTTGHPVCVSNGASSFTFTINGGSALGNPNLQNGPNTTVSDTGNNVQVTTVNATNSQLGAVELNTDLGGSATTPNVKGINGVLLSGLGTGLLKNTTSTGAPSIAAAGDVITLLQSLSGCNVAANVLVPQASDCVPQSGGGGMTWPGTAGIANYAGSNTWGTSYSSTNAIPNNFLGTFAPGSNGLGPLSTQTTGSLTTGLAKVTTTTGLLSTAALGDVTALFTGTGLLRSNGAASELSQDVTTSGSNAATVVALRGTSLPTFAASTGILYDTNGTFSLPSTLPTAAEPAHTGDAINTAGNLALTVKGINGTLLSGLATGILKNTTSTGIPSIAVAADFPNLNQSTTGNAATATALSTTGGNGTFWGTVGGVQQWATPTGSGTVNSGSLGHLAYYASSTTAVSDMGADFTFATHTLTGDSSSVLDLHAAAGSGLLLPGALSTGLVTVTTSTGAISSVAAPAGTVVGTTDTQTLSSKTLTSPTINGGALSGTFTGGATLSGNLTLTGSNAYGTPASINLTNGTVLPLTGLATGTANTLIGYNNSGIGSDVAIGSGLSLSGGTLSSTSAGGTVTFVDTTAPITGGPFSTTGTIACTICVTSTSPGAGIAHFAGSTQNVTSSAIVNADITSMAESKLTGSAAVTTITEAAAGDVVTRAGVETGNLTAPYVFQNTNSTNSNTSLGALIGAAGTSTGGIGLVVFDVSGTSDLADFYSGGSASAGVYTPGTKEVSIGATGNLSIAGGMTAGSPAGGSEGAGTVNASGLYVNGVVAVTLTGTQTLTNKTLTTPTINGAALSGTLSGSPTFSGTPVFSNTLALNTSGNAGTATALASGPSQCSGGEFATGIAVSGAANCNTKLTDVSNLLTYTGTGGITASAGPISAASDGTHAAALTLVGNTTLPSGLTTTGLSGFVGFNSTSATSYFLQLPTAAPATATPVLSCPTPSSNFSSCTWIAAGGTTTDALTINNSGSGASSGASFNGSAAVTISYNTIGAASSGANANITSLTGLTTPLTAGQGGSGVANTANFTLGTSNVNLATLGSGIVYNTTTTGALTNATASQILSACTGCAPLASPTFTGTVTTPLTTAGLVTTTSGGALGSEALATASQGGTGVANTATLTLGTSPRNYATLATGLEVNTTTTGAVSTATAHNVAVPLACADTSASGTAQSCTTSPTFVPASGDCVLYTTTTANTGALTLNVNSSAADAVQKWMGTALASGDVPANHPQPACFDGTHWQLSTIGNAPSGGVASVNTLTGAVVVEAATAGQVAISGGNAAALTGAADLTYATHTFSGISTTIFDLSPATGTAAFKVPVKAGETATAAGVVDFDSTNNNYHGYVNGADSIFLNIAAAPTTNVIPKYVVSGGNTIAGSSSITDNGTTATSTDTGGYVAPVFVANGTTAGFVDYPQGTTSSAVAPCNTATSICEQAPTSVTSYLVTKAGAGPANNNMMKSYTSGASTTESFVQASQKTMLTSAYTNATTSATTIMSFAVDASTSYVLRCHGLWKSATGGYFGFGMTGPTTPTLVTYNFVKTNTLSSAAPTRLEYNGSGASYPTGIGETAVSTAATDMAFDMEIGFTNGTTAGTLAITGLTVSADTLTVEAGSFCVMQ